MQYHLYTQATLYLPPTRLGRLLGRYMTRPTPIVAEAVLCAPPGLHPRLRLALDDQGRPEIILHNIAAPEGIDPSKDSVLTARIREKGSGKGFKLRVRMDTTAAVEPPPAYDGPTNTARFDLPNGEKQIKAMGKPFGRDADLLDWRGPSDVAFADMTRANARAWVTIDGHFGENTPDRAERLRGLADGGPVAVAMGGFVGEQPSESVMPASTGDLFDKLAVPRKGVMIPARDVADAGMTRFEIMAQEADDEAERLTTAAGNTSSAKRGRDYAARALEFTERARLLRAAIRQTGALEWMKMDRPEHSESGFIRWEPSNFGEWARVRMPPWCDAIVVWRDRTKTGVEGHCEGRVMLPHQLYRQTAAKMLEGYPASTRLIVTPYRSAHRVWLPGDDAPAG